MEKIPAKQTKDRLINNLEGDEYLYSLVHGVDNYSLVMLTRILDDRNVEKLARMYYQHLVDLSQRDIKEYRKEIKSLPFTHKQYYGEIVGEAREENGEHLPKREYAVDYKEFQDIIANNKKDISVDYLKEKIRETIKTVFSVTHFSTRLALARIIAYGASGYGGNINSKSRNPFSKDNERYSQMELSLIEAHEKGHGIRIFLRDSSVTEKIKKCFDVENIEFSEPIVDTLLKQYKGTLPYEEREKEKGLRLEILDILEKYEQSTVEILERMSQIKNYFGMTADDIFTKERLNYAKKHMHEDLPFVKEQMYAFFSMIKAGKEDNFVELMNELPI